MKISPLLLTTLLIMSGCTSVESNVKTAAVAPAADDAVQKSTWKKHIVDAGPGLAADIKDTDGDVNAVVASDFDKDGHVDIMASYSGLVALYRGPNWEKKIVMPKMPLDWIGRSATRGCIHATLMDVDGDGDMDFIGSNRMLFWLECPANPFTDPWVRRMISLDVNGAHCVTTADVDRDGVDDLIANSWRDKTESIIPNSITWIKVPANPKEDKLWTPHLFANGDAPGRNHYMGFGDINKDGRGDIACAAPEGGWFAWWEQPTDPTTAWKKHVLSDKDKGATNILIVDLNGDGHLDFLGSRGHTDGVLWFKGPTFERIEIDPSIKTPHCLAAADLDGDGDLDFATCSSYLNQQAAWYENDGSGKFTKHVIDINQCAYDIRLVDLDNDGDLDILIGGHTSRNVVWYENPLKQK